jgi:AcrR family transcriptional regulator
MAERGRRSELSRERIAIQALRYLDRHGLEALSMRRLAGDLGVGTMTLYGYFRDKDELLDAVVDAATAERPVPKRRGRAWRPYLRELLVGMHASLCQHPGLVGIRLRRPIATASAFEITEAGLQALADAGLTDEAGARAFRALFLYTFGSAAFHAPPPEPDDGPPWRAVLASLPPARYPILAAQGLEVVATWSRAGQFEHGLDLLLDAIEARADQTDGSP